MGADSPQLVDPNSKNLEQTKHLRSLKKKINTKRKKNKQAKSFSRKKRKLVSREIKLLLKECKRYLPDIEPKPVNNNDIIAAVVDEVFRAKIIP